MTLIGFLHHRKDPQTVIKAYAYAVIAAAEGATMLYFSPNNVNVVAKSIRGYVYENGQWVERLSRYPDVIYNTGSPEKLAFSQSIINSLKKRHSFYHSFHR
ncbi:hypothetical protein LC087_02650 [Bacillus carboniphilus]|uniref:Uncharacterized protein n=1 Tax=Bacillus carboniphilus TaxID=86663 RepID=A0ABY9JZR7_9BACI|nr:hypothetical protein [Bacillus carboniphilus]WLR43126.1 hypothetical protein LC087_02650 [Bacillus carboniphilus]